MRIAYLILSILFLGCGVKGPPLPPDTPTEIGRGKPSYQKAMRRVPIEPVYNEDDVELEYEESEEDDEE